MFMYFHRENFHICVYFYEYMHIYICTYVHRYVLDDSEIDQTTVSESFFNGVMGNTSLIHRKKRAEFNSSATFIT